LNQVRVGWLVGIEVLVFVIEWEACLG